MKMPCVTDAIDALELSCLVLGEAHKAMTVNAIERQHANTIGIPGLVFHHNLDKVIKSFPAINYFPGLLSGQCPKGAPLHHQYIAILRLVYQCMDYQPIYVLYGTMFPCKNGGIICIGNHSRRNIFTGRRSKDKALLSSSNLLINNPKQPKDKHGHIPVNLDITSCGRKKSS